MSKKEKSEKNPGAEAASAEQAQDIVTISRALSDPTRLELLRKIADAESTTCMDMRTCLGLNPATLSHHIRQLESAGLVETNRDGKFVRATLRRKAWKGYLAQLKAFTA